MQRLHPGQLAPLHTNHDLLYHALVIWPKVPVTNTAELSASIIIIIIIIIIKINN